MKKKEIIIDIQDDMRDWISRNWDVGILNEIFTICEENCSADMSDEVDRDILAEEISNKIKEGILNILDTYEPSVP